MALFLKGLEGMDIRSTSFKFCSWIQILLSLKGFIHWAMNFSESFGLFPHENFTL